MLFYYCNSAVSRSSIRTLQNLTRHDTTRVSLDCLSKGRDRSWSNGICLFRTKAKHIDASPSLTRSSRVALFAKGLKLVRIPVLIISVYGLGYNQGIMDYARNPDKKRVRNEIIWIFALRCIECFFSLCVFEKIVGHLTQLLLSLLFSFITVFFVCLTG